MLWGIVVTLIAAFALFLWALRSGFKIIERDDHHRH